MKKGARLINCARGELIDEGALAEALRSGHLSGAAVDTFATEPPKNSPLIGLPNLIATPHIAGSTAEAQEEVGTLIALQVRDYLAEGLIRNAVNMPALSAEQYRRLRPYLELGERLGAFVAQAAASASFSRIRIRYAGEPAELGSHVIRSAVLIGILNSVLDEKVNLVNASQAAAARGLIVEETTRRRERGFPNTLEVAAENGGHALTVEGTVAQDGSPRILLLDGIELEAPLEGTLLLTRNRDVPGVIGKIGTALGNLGVNIATFALGAAAAGARRGSGGAGAAGWRGGFVRGANDSRDSFDHGSEIGAAGRGGKAKFADGVAVGEYFLCSRRRGCGFCLGSRTTGCGCVRSRPIPR